MSSSTETAFGRPVERPTIVRGNAAANAAAVETPVVRTDSWARLASGALHGDEIAEGTFTALATQVRDAARAQGYAVGWAAGRRDAIAEARAEAEAEAVVQAEQWRQQEQVREAQHAVALARLADAADAFSDALTHSCEQVESEVASLAFAVVQELLGRELAHVPAEDTVRRALTLLPDDAVATVRLHPSASAAAQTLHERAGVRVVADADLAPSDVIIDLDDRVIDGRISTAAERLRRAWSS